MHSGLAMRDWVRQKDHQQKVKPGQSNRLTCKESLRGLTRTTLHSGFTFESGGLWNCNRYLGLGVPHRRRDLFELTWWALYCHRMSMGSRHGKMKLLGYSEGIMPTRSTFEEINLKRTASAIRQVRVGFTTNIWTLEPSESESKSLSILDSCLIINTKLVTNTSAHLELKSRPIPIPIPTRLDTTWRSM